MLDIETFDVFLLKDLKSEDPYWLVPVKFFVFVKQPLFVLDWA
jgi:hypothetical protein